MTTAAVFPHSTAPLTLTGVIISAAFALLVIAGFAVAKLVAARREARRWAAARDHFGASFLDGHHGA